MPRRSHEDAPPTARRDVPVTPDPPRSAVERGAAVAVEGLSRRRGRGRHAREVLSDVTARFPPATFTAIVGPSGSGKSTLLNCAAGLDRPTRGTVTWQDQEITGLGERRLARMRGEHAGFVFQSHNLLPDLTIAQNTELPARLVGRRPDPAAVREALSRVGLDGAGRRRPAELSGGQQQRAAIARALFTRPRVVFADEPTSALDRGTADAVLRLLRAAVDEEGRAVLLVTHDPVAAAAADRVLVLDGGRVCAQLHRPTPQQVLDRLGALGNPAARYGVPA